MRLFGTEREMLYFIRTYLVDIVAVCTLIHASTVNSCILPTYPLYRKNEVCLRAATYVSLLPQTLAVIFV